MKTTTIAATQKPLVNKHQIKSYLPYSLISALIFCVTSFIFIRSRSFESSWILYVGNALFGIAIGYYVYRYNKLRASNATAFGMIVAGHSASVLAILIACVINLLLLFVLAPAVFHSSDAQGMLTDSPAQMQDHMHKGFLTSLFMNTVVGNISAGSFVSLLMPYTIKRNQKGGS